MIRLFNHISCKETVSTVSINKPPSSLQTHKSGYNRDKMDTKVRLLGVLLSVYWITLARSPTHCEGVDLLEKANTRIQEHNALNKTEFVRLDLNVQRCIQRCIVQYEGVQKNEKTGVATIQDDPYWFTERAVSSLSKASGACLSGAK